MTTDTAPPAADLLAFTPAPGNGRHDGWTPERQRALSSSSPASAW